MYESFASCYFSNTSYSNNGSFGSLNDANWTAPKHPGGKPFDQFVVTAEVWVVISLYEVAAMCAGLRPRLYATDVDSTVAEIEHIAGAAA